MKLPPLLSSGVSEASTSASPRFDDASSFMLTRAFSSIPRPASLKGIFTELVPTRSFIVKPEDQAWVYKRMPHLANGETVELKIASSLSPAMALKHRIGIILSGGPAPGGHNVLAGVYDAIKEVQSQAEILGFNKGIGGLMAEDFTLLTAETINRYRNTGGFDMLLSGRGCVKPEQEAEALAIIKRLGLTGLVIIGGDGTNSNTAAIANLVGGTSKADGPTTLSSSCCVIGVPKTIDADLSNASIEVSFGYDTAAKVYSEQIGSIMTVELSHRDTWHFVRVMGRLASHLVLECALQTHPNYVIIAEEVRERNLGLLDIVKDITDCIQERRAKGLEHGVILVPEGLLTFITEMQDLLAELSGLLSRQGGHPSDITAHLTSGSASLWSTLPSNIKCQMLDEREASGYIQVAKIATEKLLSSMVLEELGRRNARVIKYTHHYFGYEGRCAFPSVFDANYCYALGLTAGHLILHRRNGYMATVRDLAKSVDSWRPVGVKCLDILQKVTLPSGPTIAAIFRQEVQLEGHVYQRLARLRDAWRLVDHYRIPGPIQYHSPCAKLSNFFVNEAADDSDLSPLVARRLHEPPRLPSICEARAWALKDDSRPQTIVKGEDTVPIRVGICFFSAISAGVNNLLHSMCDSEGVEVVGFVNGLSGLFSNKRFGVSREGVVGLLNQGGLLSQFGTSSVDCKIIRAEEGLALASTCQDLEGLVLVGDSAAIATQIAGYLRKYSSRCSIVFCAQSPVESCIHRPVLGLATNVAVQASLIGNAATDAKSMPKYYHFVRVDTAQSHSVELLDRIIASTRASLAVYAEHFKHVAEIVSFVADYIQMRHIGTRKNYGVVLIPTALWGRIYDLDAQLRSMGLDEELLKPLAVATNDLERSRFVPIEAILGVLVGRELKKRDAYAGEFQFVSHNLTYQGRGALPCEFDANLGAAYGSAAILALRAHAHAHAIVINGDDVLLQPLLDDQFASPGPVQFATQ